MRNYENEVSVDRRRFLAGIGLLSAMAITGCQAEASSAQIVLASDEKFLPPLAPPAPETRDARGDLQQAWQEIIDDRAGRIDIAAFNSATGQISRASNTNEKFKTASIIKLSILEKLLMDQPDWARSNVSYISPMITLSDNTVASALWSRVGGTGEMQAFFNSIGAGGIIAGGYDGGLFSTLTTATDQLAVVNNAAYAAHMRPEDAEFARNLLRQVTPGQRWGVTGGVPTGVSVELKNGWVDERRHSIGHVNGQGIDYTIAVLTDDGPGAGYDTETIELLSAKTWQIMSGAA